MTYPTTAPSATPANHGIVAAEVEALGKYGLPVYNVVTGYGATGNGSTNDTTAVQAAITAANAAGGGIVYFPIGTYLCGDLTIPTGGNLSFRGTGLASIVKKTLASSYLFTANSGGSGVQIPNVSFYNLQFRGTVDVDTTFSEQKHLLNLNGMADLTIRDCQFVGWHGDAIYLGSGNTGGQERHNSRVKVLNCFFDGLTKNQRNCISVIDGEDVLVQGNTSRRHTTAVMPGFMDCEPNAGSTFAILKDIRCIDNNCYDFNGTCFQLYLQDASYTQEPSGFQVSRNHIDAPNADLFYMVQNRTVTQTTVRNAIIISNNEVTNGKRLWTFMGMSGIKIIDNLFANVPLSGLIGYNLNTFYTEIRGNDFLNCARTDGAVLNVIRSTACQIIANRFDDCGLANGTIGEIVKFGTDGTNGASTLTDLIDNVISGTLMTQISELSASHTTTPATNLRRGYRYNGLTPNAAHFGTALTN